MFCVCIRMHTVQGTQVSAPAPPHPCPVYLDVLESGEQPIPSDGGILKEVMLLNLFNHRLQDHKPHGVSQPRVEDAVALMSGVEVVLCLHRQGPPTTLPALAPSTPSPHSHPIPITPTSPHSLAEGYTRADGSIRQTEISWQKLQSLEAREGPTSRGTYTKRQQEGEVERGGVGTPGGK